MPFLLTLATDDDRRVVVDSLRSASDQRTRVARRLAADVSADKRAGKDARSAAMKVAGLLDEANTLAQAADQLAGATNLLMIEHTTPPNSEQPSVHVTTENPDDDPDDDGTSPAAQAVADLAGLTDNPEADPDAEDEHGASAEDRAGAVESVL